jgi:alkyl sulfatase BDS1-like metallo-beta-lactamase superfamily hydrolase
MNHVVFADPSNQDARNLEADALEQLGYQSENATWRNEYLMGAYELRNGIPTVPGTDVASPDTLKAMPLDMYLDYLGIRLNGNKAQGKKILINLNITDTQEKYALILQDSVLLYTPQKQMANADTTIILSRDTFNNLMLKKKSMEKGIADGSIKVNGNKAKIAELMGMFDDFPPMFNIITSNMKG